MTAKPLPSQTLPSRRGPRPKTLPGPLHIQCNDYGDQKYLEQLIDRVLPWPHIEFAPSMASRPTTIFIRLKQTATVSEPSALIADREFARILLGAPTIYLVLPLICAHWAILHRWAEPHYLASYGLMPAGTMVVYVPRDAAELEVCAFLFEESYRALNGSRLHLEATTREARDDVQIGAAKRERGNRFASIRVHESSPNVRH